MGQCMSSKTGGPAYKASHTGKYECSAEAMWKSLSQWEPDYLTKVDTPAGEIKDVKGSGVGAVRTVMAAGPDGTQRRLTLTRTAPQLTPPLLTLQASSPSGARR